MNLALLDWLILGGMFIVIVGGGLVARHSMRSVADFLVAGRTAGRYLITVAHGMAMLGAISIVRDLEMNYEAGFAMEWWGLSMALVLVLLAVTGWVNYRFRQTRALTLAEFFERRYSRRFRIFGGLVAFLAGLVNFGIFPAVGARFFISFIGFPSEFIIFGASVSTYPVTMAVLLIIAVFFVFIGGQVAVLITDFLQGAFANVVFVLLAAYLLFNIDWTQVVEVLSRAPAGESKLNPFDTSGVETFNFKFFAIGVIGVMYTAMSWQGTQAYNASAKTAHEAKMGQVLGTWRGVPQSLLILLVPISAFVVMHHPEWAFLQEKVNVTLSAIDNEAVRNQMRTPTILVHLLPVGLIGAFSAMMLGAFISTHNTYLHSWGSIFIQDVVMPFRRRPISPRHHLLLLRVAIIGVAVFIFLFSLLYQQNQAIALFLALTGTLFAGWSGACIIGGLYTRWGTTSGAWASGFVGVFMVMGWFILQSANTSLDTTGVAFWGLLDWIGVERAQAIAAWMIERFPNGQELWGLSMFTCLLTYVVVSLGSQILRPHRFNIERLLNRGRYAIEGEAEMIDPVPARGWRMLGMNEQFTRRDKTLYVLTYVWTVAWVLIFIGGTIYFLTRKVSDNDWSGYNAGWARFWYVVLWIKVVVATLVVIWFTIGGFRDLGSMLRRLRSMDRDDSDDGVVRKK